MRKVRSLRVTFDKPEPPGDIAIILKSEAHPLQPPSDYVSETLNFDDSILSLLLFIIFIALHVTHWKKKHYLDGARVSERKNTKK